MNCVLGLDIGTTNTKALLLDAADGREVLSASRRTGAADSLDSVFEPEAVFDGVVRLVREVVKRADGPEFIRALAISSMGETGVPLDAEGRPAYPAIAWHDTRAGPQARLWVEQVGEERLYEITGLPLSTSYGLLKLMWLRDNEPEIYGSVCRWLPIGDYVVYRLCGVQCTDRTQAWRTMAFDVSRMDWSDVLLGEAGMGRQLMPEVVVGGTPLAGITPEAARATGLPADCMAVAGGMDAACGMVAVGAIRPGVGLDVIGTSEMVLTTLPVPVLSGAGMAESVDVGPHVVGGHLAFGSMTASGAVVEWFARLVGGGDDSALPGVLDALTREAESLLEEGGMPSLVLPHFRGSRTPHTDPASRGALAGLDLRTTRGQIFLGLLESLCLESRRVVDSLCGVVGQPLAEMWVAGGASANPLWMSLKAGAMGCDLLVPESFGISAFGAAVLAACGAGFYPSPGEAAGSMRVGHHVVSRDRRVPGYRRVYDEAYGALYASLRDVNHRFAGFTLSKT